jgi:hypothetical protein
MEMNGLNHAISAVVASASCLNGAPAKDSLATEELNEIHGEIRHLWLELERLQALQIIIPPDLCAGTGAGPGNAVQRLIPAQANQRGVNCLLG